MKKILIILIIIITFTLVCGCSRTYKVTFDIYSGISESQIVKKGDKIKDFKPYLEGHTFVSWLYNDEVFDVNTPIENNITLQAYWSLNEYNVEFISDNEIYFQEKLAYGDIIKEVEKPIKEDYLFFGWLQGGSIVTFPQYVTGDISFVARWQKDSEYTPELKISFNSTGAKIEYDDIKIHRLDEMPTLPSPTYEKHQFLGWYIDGSDEEIKTGDIIKELEDFTLIAKWEKIE